MNNNMYKGQGQQFSQGYAQYPQSGYSNSQQAQQFNNGEQQKIERLKQLFIVEKYGSDSLVSASMRSFNINKIVFTFVKFDKNTNKSKQTIDIYIDFEDFYRIYNGLLVNKDYLNNAFNNFKNKGQNAYAADINLLHGGTSAASLQRQGKGRNDGKPEYRGLNMNFMMNKKNEGLVFIKAIKGAGKVNERTKGISLERQESFIGVSFTKHELSGFMELCKAHIEAYLNYKVGNIFRG